MNSYCKNCKRMEENERIMIFTLNEILNGMGDVLEKEKMWRQGKISFEYENPGNFAISDVMIIRLGNGG